MRHAANPHEMSLNPLTPERFNPFNWEWEEALNPIVGERLLKKEWKDRRLFTA